MLKAKDKLTVIQSNLSAIEILAQQVIEQVRHASEEAPENYNDESRCNYLIGGLGNLVELAADINNLAKAIVTIKNY